MYGWLSTVVTSLPCPSSIYSYVKFYKSHKRTVLSSEPLISFKLELVVANDLIPSELDVNKLISFITKLVLISDSFIIPFLSHDTNILKLSNITISNIIFSCTLYGINSYSFYSLFKVTVLIIPLIFDLRKVLLFLNNLLIY